MESFALTYFIARVKRRLHFYFMCIMARIPITDKARWKNVERETQWWDERNKIIASYIPQGQSVLDVGAGAQTLRNYLLNNRYVPCDVVSRPGTLYCDLNKDIYPPVIEKFDYIVCSGVIEYLSDPTEVISNLSKLGDNMILSYAPLHDTHQKDTRILHGWKNHLTEEQLEGIFLKSGLKWKVLEHWSNQIIYSLHK
jgi:hypothetical protein